MSCRDGRTLALKRARGVKSPVQSWCFLNSMQKRIWLEIRLRKFLSLPYFLLHTPPPPSHSEQNRFQRQQYLCGTYQLGLLLYLVCEF